MGTPLIKRRPAADMLYDEIGQETPDAGQDYLQKTISSVTSDAMPAFENRLQDVRENAIRRGVSNGLGTSYEGDLASAFQRNIVNEVGSRAQAGYESSRNRYLDLLSGQRDYETEQENMKRKKKSGILSGLLGLAGAGVGAVAAGPYGASVGSRIGGAAGQAIGGY